MAAVRTANLCLPEQLLQRGSRLLNQQCWYWGCDVRRPAGNLLLEYGFSRTRRPDSADNSTAYTLEPAPGTQLILWSFGVFYGSGGSGIFLERLRFEPLLLPCAHLDPAAVGRIDHLPARRRAAAVDHPMLTMLLGDLLQQIIVYEQTVLSAHRIAYREACLTQWSRRALGLPAAAFLPAWLTLAEEIDRRCLHTAAAVEGD